ncbi:hypothetical protein GCM10023347_15720 [Streptomyces chumphonensis]
MCGIRVVKDRKITKDGRVGEPRLRPGEDVRRSVVTWRHGGVGKRGTTCSASSGRVGTGLVVSVLTEAQVPRGGVLARHLRPHGHRADRDRVRRDLRGGSGAEARARGRRAAAAAAATAEHRALRHRRAARYVAS